VQCWSAKPRSVHEARGTMSTFAGYGPVRCSKRSMRGISRDGLRTSQTEIQPHATGLTRQPRPHVASGAEDRSARRSHQRKLEKLTSAKKTRHMGSSCLMRPHCGRRTSLKVGRNKNARRSLARDDATNTQRCCCKAARDGEAQQGLRCNHVMPANT